MVLAMFGNIGNGNNLGGGDGDGGIITADIVDTTLDFVPIAGGVNDIRKGIRDGDGWQVALGAGIIVLDIFTLESASLVKGDVKTGEKIGVKSTAKAVAKNAYTKGKLYTKSSLKEGRTVHKTYKLQRHNQKLKRFKEYGKIKGIRPDFIDFNKRTIYELKPFNPNGIKSGAKQLNRYKTILEKRTGEKWKTVLDFY